MSNEELETILQRKQMLESKVPFATPEELLAIQEEYELLSKIIKANNRKLYLRNASIEEHVRRAATIK